MAKSSIEWTDETWNPVVGCSRVSPGCEHCYAETMAARCVLMARAQGRESVYLPVVDAGRRRWNRTARPVPGRLSQPLRWRKPRRVFVNSMSDLFHEDISFEYIAAVHCIAGAARESTFQFLTKRPARAVAFYEWLLESASERDLHPWQLMFDHLIQAATVDAVVDRMLGSPRTWPLPNVWLGVSVEDQQRADERIPLLLQCPAAVRFLSVEPLLGEVRLRAIADGSWYDKEGANKYDALTGTAFYNDGTHGLGGGPLIDWAIVGLESGPGRRSGQARWVRALRDDCASAGTPFFFKQWGHISDNPDPTDTTASCNRTDKKGAKGGRLLDGRTWDEMPEVRP